MHSHLHVHMYPRNVFFDFFLIKIIVYLFVILLVNRLAFNKVFERFTEKAIKVVMLSQEESRRLGHNFVGTEQILLGLIGENGGVAYKVLRTFG